MLQYLLFVPLIFLSITTKGKKFLDEKGRELLLRGVNVSGICKHPFSENGSFVNRPFPLEEAKEHLHRIKDLGMNHIRFLTTWEAIEGKGPKVYDEEYIAYVVDFCQLAADMGIYVLIDMHQDLFSRHLFGSGAPRWALEAAGLDLKRLVEADALVDPYIVQQQNPEYLHLAWYFNYNRIACQTMFTLFFGGKTFTPSFAVGSKNIQDFLQSHYIDALSYLMERLKQNRFVIGCNTINEPSPGLIGRDLTQRPENPVGPSPKYGDSLAIGAGHSVEVGVFERKMTQLFEKGTTLLNPKSLSIFKYGCPFEKEGIYTKERGNFKISNPYYFQFGTFPYDFQRDFYFPFVLKIKERLEKIHPNYLLFIEGVVGENLPHLPEKLEKNCVYSFHWYEGIAFYLKKFISNLTYSHLEKKVLWGRSSYIQKKIQQELSLFADHPIPCILSETGFSQDISLEDRRKCFYRLFSVLEKLKLSTTFWHYSPKGDRWNFENFSIFKEGEENDLSFFYRPYPQRVPGELLNFSFDPDLKILSLEWLQDPNNGSPLEIYCPNEFELKENLEFPIIRKASTLFLTPLDPIQKKGEGAALMRATLQFY
ncbi:MAG: glycoside hydrolase family 5 protein [Chlamydiae bacterium]|nr:glycoside hydrolase family 5 protein [Chlamydiota bacterium]